MKNDLISVLLFVLYSVVIPVVAFLCQLKLLNGYLFTQRRTSGSLRELYEDNAEALEGGDDQCK